MKQKTKKETCNFYSDIVFPECFLEPLCIHLKAESEVNNLKKGNSLLLNYFFSVNLDYIFKIDSSTVIRTIRSEDHTPVRWIVTAHKWSIVQPMFQKNDNLRKKVGLIT